MGDYTCTDFIQFRTDNSLALKLKHDSDTITLTSQRKVCTYSTVCIKNCRI